MRMLETLHYAVRRCRPPTRHYTVNRGSSGGPGDSSAESPLVTTSEKLFRNPPQGDHEAGDMKERSVTLQQSLIAHHHAAKVADPCNRTFYSPAPLRSARLRSYQLDASLRQLLPQRVTDVTPVGKEAFRLLPGAAGLMPPPYPDCLDRRFREIDLRRGSSRIVGQCWLHAVPEGRQFKSGFQNQKQNVRIVFPNHDIRADVAPITRRPDGGRVIGDMRLPCQHLLPKRRHQSGVTRRLHCETPIHRAEPPEPEDCYWRWHLAVAKSNIERSENRAQPSVNS
jgi:hypothetical protein